MVTEPRDDLDPSSEVASRPGAAGSGAPPTAFVLDSPRQELRVGRTVRTLPPKSFDVLRVLVERSGEVVTRADLVEHVWQGLAVSNDAVRYTLRQLRKALEDSVGEPRFIATVSRRGWRFVGRVEPGAPGVFRLLARGEGASQPARGVPARPLVGRSVELAFLRDAFERVGGGRSELVFVRGEAGIGKTSLVQAFVAWAEQNERAVVARGECIEHYGAGQPWLPLLEALEGACEALGGELPRAVLDRHAPTWLAQLPSLTEPAERAHLADRVQGATQVRMIRELGRALERLSERRPLVVWLEDLHWADGSTREALAYLAHRPAASPLLIMASLRPDAVLGESLPLDTWIADLERRGLCRILSPSVLSEEDLRNLLRARFGEESAPAASEALVDSLRRLGGGNPLFTVSVLDELVERGLIARDGDAWRLADPGSFASVPARLEPLLERQLASLDAETRSLLEVASVIGQDFSVMELDASLDLGLERLEGLCEGLVADGRFVLARGVAAWPDGSVGSSYRFVHSLHRTVLREGLSAGRLSRIHRATAERKLAGFGDRADEIAAELALHFERGLEPARAIEFRARAGEAAARRFSNREACVHLRAGLALVEGLPTAERFGPEIRLRLALCAPLAATEGYGAPDLAENLARLAELTRDIQDSPAMFPVLLGLWSLTLVRGDLAATQRLGDRLLALAERDATPIVRLQAHRAVGHCLFYAGDLAAAERHFATALDGYDVEGHRRQDYAVGDDPLVLVDSYRAWSLWFQGRPAQAVASVERAVRNGERLAHPPSLAFALSYGAVLHLLRRDVRRAWEWSDRVFELAREEGMALWLALAQIVRGWAIARDDDPQAGIAMLEEGIAGWEATGSDLGRPYFLAQLARALDEAGESERARSMLREVEGLIRRTGQWIFEPERLRIEGEMLWRVGSASEERHDGRARLEASLELARSQGAFSLELRAALSLAERLSREGEAARAGDLLREAMARFEEVGDEADARRARVMLEVLASA